VVVSHVDQMGRQVEIPFPPSRIISLVPSQTELLSDLHLDQQVAGITRFCVHPACWKRTKPTVGGTKTLDVELIISLNPDLILANREENDQMQVELLANRFPVWISDIGNVPEAVAMIGSIGTITGKETEALAMCSRIREKFSSFPVLPLPRAAYMIWRKPWMTVGGDTFISEMMRYLGFENIFERQKRYPIITIEQIAAEKPAWVLLSSEPFPFSDKHASEIRAALPGTRVQLVDGEMFSWYGSRMLQASIYLMELRKELGL
jgi:ABC-type Fe3+-hydroxamate transport system substrate-binding protein